jgi:hypothetical protein
MQPRKLARKFLWILVTLAVALIFIGLDWLPTLKDINRLRREQRDETLIIKNFAVMAASFVFPDAEEKSLFAQNNVLLRRSLPQMYDNDAWLAMALLELQAQARAEGIANALVLLNHHAVGAEFDAVNPGRPAELADWVALQYWDIQEGFGIARDPSRYSWHNIFSGLEFVRKQRLASRVLGVVLAAPLPALLNFINHISWGEARLEIVRLHLEPGAALSRAWLICRGNYLVRKPSAWAVKEGPETLGDNLLVDPDSPLLWQPVNPEAVGLATKNELPPLRDTGLFIHKKN